MRGKYSWKVGDRGPRGDDSAHEGLVTVVELHNGAEDNQLKVLEASLVKDKSTRWIDTGSSETLVVNNTFASTRYLTRKKIAELSIYISICQIQTSFEPLSSFLCRMKALTVLLLVALPCISLAWVTLDVMAMMTIMAMM